MKGLNGKYNAVLFFVVLFINKEVYPFNLNGSPFGMAGLCSENGRHLAMMSHSERSFLLWQLPWIPGEWKDLEASPWLQMFQNAYDWCIKQEENK